MFNRPPSFTQRVLFSTKAGIDQAEHAQGRSIIGLLLDQFLFLYPSGRKGRAGFGFVLHHPCDQTLSKCAVEMNSVVAKVVFSQGI